MEQTYLGTVLRRRGTLLLAVVIADTVAYQASDAGRSAVGVLCYLLQMLLIYRIWRGANLVPWAMSLLLTGFEGYNVHRVITTGAGSGHAGWVAAHAMAALITVFVLLSPKVRAGLLPLRGMRQAA